MEFTKQFDSIAEFLGKADRLRRQSEVVIWIPRMLIFVIIASLFLGVVIRLLPVMDETGFITLVIALILGSSILVTAIVFAKTRTLIDKARYVDKKLSLQERASTAAEIHLGVLSVTPELAMKQWVNTIDSIGRIDLRSAISPTINREELLILLVVMAISVANILVPNPQYEIIREQQEIERTISEQISTLESIREEIASDNQLNEESKDIILAPVEDAIEKLQEGQLSREEALAVLSQAEKELRELGAGFDPEFNQRALAEAGQALSSSPNASELGAALESGDLAGAAQAANSLNNELADLDGEARSDLAEGLANAGAILRDADQEFADVINEVAQAIQSGDDELAQEKLVDLIADLEEAAGLELAADVAQSAADQAAASGQEVAGSTQAGSPNAGQSDSNLSAGANGEASDDTGGQATGNSPETSSGDQQGPGSPGRGGGRAENVFTPDIIDLGTQSGVPVELPANCIGDSADCGLLSNESTVGFGDENSVIPYTEVFAEYRDSAYQALERELIPLSMKDYIRDYFTSLEP